MTSDDQLRRDFICRLFRYDTVMRDNLLRIEQDDEVIELKRVALDMQHFEMAAYFQKELTRRGTEKPVSESP